MGIGFLVISFACTYNTHVAAFYVSLVASVVLGTVSSFGESTTLGFCKGFPSTVVGYFGSGTGFAGVFGSGFILIMKSIGLDNGTIFFIITPTVVPYLIAFWWVYSMKQKYPYIPDGSVIESPKQGHHYSSMDTDDVALTSKVEACNVNSSYLVPAATTNPKAPPTIVEEFDEAKGNKQLSMALLSQMIKKVGFF
jgi:hypothetical protein